MESTLILRTLMDVEVPLAVMATAAHSMREPIKEIDAEINLVKQSCQKGKRYVTPTQNMFSVIGACAYKLLGDLSQWREGFSQMLLDKHKRYGAAPLLGWGTLGIMIRISSKFERYMNLREHPELEGGDESIQDTLKDLLGYAVLGYLVADLPEAV